MLEVYNRQSFHVGEFNEFDLDHHTILLGYRGSISHGMYIAPEEEMGTDDKDIMGVIVPPKDYYLGLKYFEGIEYKKDQIDFVGYELRKYVRMLLASNPNVLCLLWLEPEHYIKQTPAGNLLIENRNIFVSKVAYKSFVGYANEQMKKMERSSNEKRYEGYMGKKRKVIFDKFGYDTKQGSHLIRLLRSGIEYLETGKLNVKRKDALELIEIKKGKWPLKDIKEEANLLFAKAQIVRDNSKLPNLPDFGKANKLCKEIILGCFEGGM